MSLTRELTRRGTLVQRAFSLTVAEFNCDRAVSSCAASETTVLSRNPVARYVGHEPAASRVPASQVLAGMSMFNTNRAPLRRHFHASSATRYAVGDVTTIDVPSLGAESISEGAVGSLLKAVGDVVEEDEVIAQLETDKVTIDVKYQGSGTVVVKKYYVGEGDTVNVGDKFADVEEVEAGSGREAASAGKAAAGADAHADGGAGEAPKKASKKKEQAAPKVPAPPSTPSTPAGAAYGDVGSGNGDPLRPERRVKMTRLRKRVAERLKGSQNTYAMLTTFQECDMTALMMMRTRYKDEFLDKHGVKLGFMSAFVKAAANALQYVPSVNAVIEDDDIVYRDFIDISVAVSTPKGLVVPVLRNVESMSFADIEKTINELGRKARDGSLSIDEMAGGTFTISNGGVFGSLMGTPIINPPQSAILGMHSIQQRPAVVDGQVVARPMMYLALTYDHRLIDGREAVTVGIDLGRRALPRPDSLTRATRFARSLSLSLSVSLSPGAQADQGDHRRPQASAARRLTDIIVTLTSEFTRTTKRTEHALVHLLTHGIDRTQPARWPRAEA